MPTRTLLTIAALLLPLLLTTGCDTGCRSACTRIVPCLHQPDLDQFACTYVCGEVERRMEKREQEEAFDAFLSCAGELDYSRAETCRPQFVACSGKIPPSVWKASMREGQKKARQMQK